MALISSLATRFRGWSLTIRSLLHRAARSLVLGRLATFSSGLLCIQDPYGSEIAVVGNAKAHHFQAPAILVVHDDVFWMRALLFGDIGFSQSYMLREISTPNLTAVFEFFVQNASKKSILASWRVVGLFSAMTRAIFRRANDISAAKLNAVAHYSLGNDMFSAFLSPDMTYSAALWLPTTDPRSQGETLEEAQMRKLQYAISSARIKSTDHVLEVGSGWGSFAILAAKMTGCRVTTVTLSLAQKRLVESRVAEAKLSEHVQVFLGDYREVGSLNTTFDKIVSIEMIEHVGHEFLDTYFACMDRYLKNDGVGYFQCITIPEARYDAYVKGEDFIQKYIFPGGHLPTVSGLVHSINVGSEGKIVVEEILSFGGHYIKTLQCWRDNFLTNFNEMIAPALRKEHPHMTDADLDIFKRKWNYYFCYCEAGFRTKTIGDVGITVGREGAVELLERIPFNR
ncbi:methoxy mycolic acid synthase 1 [Cordyceps fumosorosea ARSEF 2679]|uniref:Methoxy mycolic acid synthase 1 n=1 Tax=Cordyceps fumosorosea (strain ARSEF 2679) TaxID=1081104 RepID=A0A168ESW6_CORFA|nr:methoxy mycolic acid synthase 1 [Cordyceps fumosorosea ARSEF 2679]OAA74175.1 methoxy mycolic acid synthase 1 [Cordyceps fumosorosea ARSEF 2679]